MLQEKVKIGIFAIVRWVHANHTPFLIIVSVVPPRSGIQVPDRSQNQPRNHGQLENTIGESNYVVHSISYR